MCSTLYLLTGRKQWKNLACIGAIHTEFTKDGKTSSEWHYYISSRKLSPDELLRHARLEWAVESIHWLLDVHFQEDKTKVWDMNVQEVLNVMRKIALNLAREYKNRYELRKPISGILKRNLFDVNNLADFLNNFIALFRLFLSSILSSKSSAPSLLSVSVKAILHAPLLISISNIPSQGQPACAVFCGRCIASSSFVSKTAIVRSFPKLGTMTSADFLQFSRTSPHGFDGCHSFCPSPPCKTSPIKSSNLPLIYLPHLHHGVRAVWDFVLLGRLVRPVYALYAISVRQTESLP